MRRWGIIPLKKQQLRSIITIHVGMVLQIKPGNRLVGILLLSGPENKNVHQKVLTMGLRLRQPHLFAS